MAKQSKAWATAERKFASDLIRFAGPPEDVVAGLLTPSGRVGQLTHLEYDLVAGQGPMAIIGEAKRRKLPAWLRTAMIKVQRRGVEVGKLIVMGLQFSTDVPLWTETDKGKRRVVRNWMVVPWEFGMELLAARRYLTEKATPATQRKFAAYLEELRNAET